MNELPTSMPSPSSLLNSLRAFASSSSNLQILHRVGLPSSTAGPLVRPYRPKTLYILDSSFNPPTLAHLRICLSALQNDSAPSPKTLLLLLATQNADKPPKPAAFEQRLAMMNLLGEEVHGNVQDVSVDIALCKPPLFVDKVRVVAQSELYGDETEQVHLIGFDTLIRLLDPKYYPPEHTLQPLEALFRKHRVRVTKRAHATSDDQEQEDYAANLGSDLENKAGSGFWADKIKLVEGRGKGEEAISSTRVREAVEHGDEDALRTLVPMSICSWIQQERLYKNED